MPILSCLVVAGQIIAGSCTPVGESRFVATPPLLSPLINASPVTRPPLGSCWSCMHGCSPEYQAEVCGPQPRY